MKGGGCEAVRHRIWRGAGRDAGPERGRNGDGDKRAKFLAAVVKDLKAAGAEALVVAGPRQPASVHALAALINQTLGSARVTYTKAGDRQDRFGRRRAEGARRAKCRRARFRRWSILGGNPAYTAPADLQFAVGAFEGREFDSPGRGRRRNRRGREMACSAKRISLKPGAMQRTSDGVVAIQQPMIEPMYGGKTPSKSSRW